MTFAEAKIFRRRFRQKQYEDRYRAKKRALNPPIKVPLMTYGAVKTRRYRQNRITNGLKEYFMLGYDGPQPTIKSTWSLIMDYHRYFSLKKVR